MPITQRVDHARHLMFAEATGDVSFDEVRAHLDVEERLGGLAYPEMIDARTMRLVLSSVEVRRLVALVRHLGERQALGPTAVVVDSDYAYGMVRMLEMLVEDVCAVRPFRDRAEADAWLDAQTRHVRLGGVDGGV